MCAELVGREAEAAVLENALSKGEGELILVLGEAGVGKSRLVREARVRAMAHGRSVLFGRATDRGAPAPFRPLAEALISGFSTPPQLTSEELAPFAGIIRRVVPQWGGQSAADGETGLLAAGEAVVRLLVSIDGRRGALLVLEDLHWADPETLAVVEYLGDHIGRTRTVCVGTMRTGEGHEIERLARRLGEGRSALILEPHRLRSDEVDRMVAVCLDAPTVPSEVLLAVRDHSEGVPLVVEEMLAALVGDDTLVRDDHGWHLRGEVTTRVPLTFADSIARRLDSFDRADRVVVEAAAMLGRRFDWTLLAAATGLSERAVIEGLRRAVAAQILVEETDAFAFRHALSRDAVLDRMLAPDRQRCAAACLAASDHAHPGLPGAWCALAAGLAEESGQPGRAIELLLDSAGRAIERGAPASAEVSLSRARGLVGDDAELHGRIDEVSAQAASLAGDVDRALELGRGVLAASGEVLDGTRRAALALVLARAALQAGRWAAARGHADDAHHLGDEIADPAVVAAAQAVSAQAAMGDGRAADAVSLARAALDLGRQAAAPTSVCEALEVLGREARPRDLAEAERRFDEARLIAERHGLALWRARALHELGTIDLFTTLRRDRLEAARGAAIDAGAVATLALVDLHLAAISLARFEPETATTAARQSADLSRRLGLATLPMALVHLAASFAMAGDHTAMEMTAAEAFAVAPDEPEVLVGIPGRARSLLHIRRADWTQARAALDDAVGVLHAHPGAWFPFWGLWALLRAVTNIDGESACAEAEAAPGAVISVNRGRILLARAVLAGRSGGIDAADALLDLADAAVVAPERVVMWTMVERLLIAPAAFEDGWGDPVGWTRAGLALFDERGMVELASACRAFLRQAGEPVPRKRGADRNLPSGLVAIGVTGREADVLRLVEAGLSNKAIGERLHLSHRTVERHVANLLVKTGAHDRHGLAALAQHADLTGS